MKNIAILLLTLLACIGEVQGKTPGIVPAPVEIHELSGEFFFDSSTGLRWNTEAEMELARYFARRMGMPHLVDGMNYLAPSNYVAFHIDSTADLPDEGYMLTATPSEIIVTGKDRAGLFYGVQTLLQLIPTDIWAGGEYFHRFSLPCVSITDYPRFAYRGFSFDVARTFTDAEGVKWLLDQMAFHKLNRLHWHLTDDEGWRIELDSHPRLAREGGFRGGDSPVRNIYGEWGRKYGGYYTKQEIRDIVAYARRLNIDVIPEFDLPGHSRAVARVYPEILCRGAVDKTAAGYDMRKVWCAAKESNYELIGQIIDELCGLFPSLVIHTGGDEVPPEQWEACPDCRALMESCGIDTKGLNTLFCNRVGEMVRERGREQGVWNEAVDGGFLDGSAVIYSWEDQGSVLDAVKKGFRTVAMPSQYCYFDMKQSAAEVGLAWGGIIDTKRVYEYEPVPAGYSDDALLGVEGAFWTETFLWNGQWWLDYQLFPRLCALSERMWSPAACRDWNEFNSRLESYHLDRLAALGIDYRGRDGIKYAPTLPANRLKAKYTVAGSVPCTARNPYSNASDGDPKTFARTVRTPLEGDWFEFTFATPAKCSAITLKTGYSAIPRYVVGPAVLEVSYDGASFVTVDDNFGYTATFRPSGPVHKIRLTVKGSGNGEEAAILHDLILVP